MFEALGRADEERAQEQVRREEIDPSPHQVALSSGFLPATR